jgi:transketolase C-terminal domain/subunit
LTEIGSNCILKRHGIRDRFCESGEPLELLKHFGLDAAGIADFVRKNYSGVKK